MVELGPILISGLEAYISVGVITPWCLDHMFPQLLLLKKLILELKQRVVVQPHGDKSTEDDRVL